MTLLLTEADVERLLDMPTTIAAVEESFRRLALGQAENSPRVRVQALGIVLHSMSAAATYLTFVGWKQYTTTRGGARFLVGLHEQDSGELIALIQANRLGQLRTGATTGVAVKHLAPPDADQVGIFGSGWQAESQLAAVAAVRPLRRAVVYSRNPERRRQFADRMSARLAIDVLPATTPEQVVTGLPIVVTATTSRVPVFDGDWLSTDTLVCAIGSNWLNKAEVDVSTVRRAGMVVCDSIECCRREAGDLVPAIEQGCFDWARAVELSDVVAGEMAGPNAAPGRNRPVQVGRHGPRRRRRGGETRRPRSKSTPSFVQFWQSNDCLARFESREFPVMYRADTSARRFMPARWIICEKSGQWATALRWAAGDCAPRLYETRSLIECRQQLPRWPASLVVLEATMANIEGVLHLLEEVRQSNSHGRAIVLSAPPMVRWEDALREGGAVHVAYTPRRLDAIVRLAERHFAQVPRPKRSLRDSIWSRLPWGRDGEVVSG